MNLTLSNTLYTYEPSNAPAFHEATERRDTGKANAPRKTRPEEKDYVVTLQRVSAVFVLSRTAVDSREETAAVQRER